MNHTFDERAILDCRFDLLRGCNSNVPSIAECNDLTLEEYQEKYDTLCQEMIAKREAERRKPLVEIYNAVSPIIEKLTLEKWEPEGLFGSSKSLDELSLITEAEFEAETLRLYPEVMICKMFNPNCLSLVHSAIINLLNQIKWDGHKYVTDITDYSKYDEEMRILAREVIVQILDLPEECFVEDIKEPIN